MTDRQLLEMAAKAAGQKFFSYIDDPLFGVGVNDGEIDSRLWNPINDDGDALRLAVNLGIQITPGTYLTLSATAYCPGSMACEEHVNYLQDMVTATRRAIVRVAAEIGRSMANTARNGPL